jgi:hypothetical protein
VEDTRKELVRADAALRQKPFPEGSDDDEAGELHADLALLNTEFNGLIVRSLGGGARRDNLFGPKEDWRYRDLKARLQALTREPNEKAASDARRYLEYLDALWYLVELAKRC